MELAFCRAADFHGGVRIRVAGDIDLAVHDQLRRALDAVLDTRPAFLQVDLSEVTLLDAGGGRVLARAARRAHEASIPFAIVEACGLAAWVLQLVAGGDAPAGDRLRAALAAGAPVRTARPVWPGVQRRAGPGLAAA
ncbi:STAS domain-containing protein [Catellatospora tritici]|uniref:STAS domain-containing protein n=1 Tax=Catellatospora tritici TaxID=2851566 RepID=UPI001C2CEABD|nr:STAS domain-containing protein [Catellatospora tritici]MBV1856679.1 STAS domain-containing protein [Catellatospora tritici]